MKITAVDIAQYLELGGVRCPACGSYDLENGRVRTDDTTLLRSVECHSCKATWDDVYALVGVTEITIK